MDIEAAAWHNWVVENTAGPRRRGWSRAVTVIVSVAAVCGPLALAVAEPGGGTAAIPQPAAPSLGGRPFVTAPADPAAVDDASPAPPVAAPVVAPHAAPDAAPGRATAVVAAQPASAGAALTPTPITTATTTATTTAQPTSAAMTAVTFALAQIGLPYVWGGDGPAAGHAGFDCSGLTTAAYAAAGVRLPRTAHTQYLAGPTVALGAALQPGDLLFYGVPSRVHHVGLYLGDGVMVSAPTFGKPVRLAYHRWRGDDFLGAGRPSVGPALSPVPLQARLPVRPPGTATDFPAPPVPPGSAPPVAVDPGATAGPDPFQGVPPTGTPVPGTPAPTSPPATPQGTEPPTTPPRTDPPASPPPTTGPAGTPATPTRPADPPPTRTPPVPDPPVTTEQPPPTGPPSTGPPSTGPPTAAAAPDGNAAGARAGAPAPVPATGPVPTPAGS